MNSNDTKVNEPKTEQTSTTNGWFNLYVDGAARGNPGDAGVGAVLYGPDGEQKGCGSRYIGTATNNEAKYEALTFGLWLAKKYEALKLKVHMDSEVVIRQLTGEYQVKAENLRPLWNKAIKRLAEFDNIKLCHIPREENHGADRLANSAINKAMKTEDQA
jgi:ribonuclease HI